MGHRLGYMLPPSIRAVRLKGVVKLAEPVSTPSPWSPVITSSEVGGRKEAVVVPAGDGWGWLGIWLGMAGDGWGR